MLNFRGVTLPRTDRYSPFYQSLVMYGDGGLYSLSVKWNGLLINQMNDICLRRPLVKFLFFNSLFLFFFMWLLFSLWIIILNAAQVHDPYITTFITTGDQAGGVRQVAGSAEDVWGTVFETWMETWVLRMLDRSDRFRRVSASKPTPKDSKTPLVQKGHLLRNFALKKKSNLSPRSFYPLTTLGAVSMKGTVLSWWIPHRLTVGKLRRWM